MYQEKYGVCFCRRRNLFHGGIMYTTINILGRTIPVYSLVGVGGVFIGIGFLFFICKYLKKDYQDTIMLLVFSLLGGLLCSKLLFLAVSWRMIAADWEFIANDFMFFVNKYIYGGMVFYGALIGAVITAVIYCKIRKYKFSDMALAPITVIPLIHGIARIGCHMVGCCYGKPTDFPLSVVYPPPHAMAGIPLFPTQLTETCANGIIFIVLLILLRKRSALLSLGVYSVMYSTARFIIEFFRGDVERGFLGPLSTSQIISAAVFIFGMVCMVKYFRAKQTAAAE